MSLKSSGQGVKIEFMAIDTDPLRALAFTTREIATYWKNIDGKAEVEVRTVQDMATKGKFGVAVNLPARKPRYSFSAVDQAMRRWHGSTFQPKFRVDKSAPGRRSAH